MPRLESSADVVRLATTDDGLRLALHHYRARDPRGQEPILCCHGLAANRLAFDLGEVSLARHLADRGYEVFVLELRGHGLSQRPAWGWSFDDYLTRDVPAAIAAVQARTGAERVHFIGHSMGGLLAYAHLARGRRDLKSAITVGSSLDYSAGTGFSSLLPFSGLLRRVPAVPVPLLARASGAFVGRWVTPYERFNVWPSNCEPALWRRICAEGFHPVSSPVMAQLASALGRGGLRSADGSRHYLSGLDGVDTPVLALAGSRDAQCPPHTARATIAKLPRAELAVFGTEAGHADEYGHWDLLMGRRVRDEVFPRILDFLARVD
ncbi:MAG: alpha/beta hydrolase [Myxococcales bacterium]|nr:alpha/beta hydrolase [Myxococcales bacterium]